MRTSTEIKSEINKAKAMNSCGLGYKAFMSSDYMRALEAELHDAMESEATPAEAVATQVEAVGFTDEELENLRANIADLSDRLNNAKDRAEKVLGMTVDTMAFDDLAGDEDDYECATLDDIRYSININLE